MSTRLYFHNRLIDKNFQNGVYNQGCPEYVNNGGIFANGVHLLGSSDQSCGISYEWTGGADWVYPLQIANSASTDDFATPSYGNGLFVIGSGAGNIYSSADCLTWTQRVSASSTNYVQSTVYSDSAGYFVAPCSAGVLRYSANGITWGTAASSGFGVARNIYSAAYNASLNQWVSCGSTGNFAYIAGSDPSGSWTSGTQGNQNLYWIIASTVVNGYVIVGQGGTILTSTNGTTWTAQTSGTANSLFCVTEVGNTLIATGSNGTILTSTNGTSWTNRTGSSTNTFTGYTVWTSPIYGSTGTAWMSGGQGNLWKTTNSGTSWTTLAMDQASVNASVILSVFQARTVYNLRTMNTSTGTSQVTLTAPGSPGSTALQYEFLAKFCSPPIGTTTTVGGGLMNLSIADSAGNSALNFWTNGVNVYIWRPSTGSKVGTIRDYTGTPLPNTSTNTVATSEKVTQYNGIPSSGISAEPGDVIICELWWGNSPSMATSYSYSIYFDGNTVNTTTGTAVTNHAGFIEFAENIPFLLQTRGNSL